MIPIFFTKQSDFRNWLLDNHSSSKELWVGFHKKSSKLPSITWPESVDEALCFGWIDGIRKSIDDKSYQIRFTPRRPKSHWSKVNIDRIAYLKKQNLVSPAGLEAFEKMNVDNSKKAAHEQKKVELTNVYTQELMSNKLAWDFFSSKAPSYRKQCRWWVMSAKQEVTRVKRLKILIDCCEKEEVIPPFKWAKK